MNELEFFSIKIKEQYGDEYLHEILDGVANRRLVTFRVNTIKATVEEVKASLLAQGFDIRPVDFYYAAFILENKDQQSLESTLEYSSGLIYLQSLSSMIPPLVLMPKENADILDMAAAPGGKTTQMAALSSNKARITACEMNTIRAKRLEYNVTQQHASSVVVINQDSRRLDEFFSFDQILLDAPCSGSGTRIDEKSFKGLTEVLVNKSVKSQLELIKVASKHLKKGGELVYSTCSIFKEENEAIIKSILRNQNLEIVPIELKSSLWKELPSSIPGVITIMPSNLFEGFFIAKLRKKS